MQDLKQRTFVFSINVAKLLKDLPYDFVNRAYINQLIRCSSSIGANYRAARRAKSDADFIYKLKIVEEENDESIYFLELLLEFNPNFKVKITELINEANELLKIFVASIITAKQRINSNKT